MDQQGIVKFACTGLGLGEGITIGKQFGIQLIGVLATFAWCGGLTFIILKLLDRLIGLRITQEQETEGLDLVLHDETDYTL